MSSGIISSVFCCCDASQMTKRMSTLQITFCSAVSLFPAGTFMYRPCLRSSTFCHVLPNGWSPARASGNRSLWRASHFPLPVGGKRISLPFKKAPYHSKSSVPLHPASDGAPNSLVYLPPRGFDPLDSTDVHWLHSYLIISATHMKKFEELCPYHSLWRN